MLSLNLHKFKIGNLDCQEKLHFLNDSDLLAPFKFNISLKEQNMKPFYIFIIALLCALFPCCYYFYTYAVSLPYLDDYWAVYDFIGASKAEFEQKRKIIPTYLFSANLEHIIAYTKGTSLMLYYILREKFSLIYLMIWGNLSWIITVFLMGVVFYRNLGKLWLGLAFFPLLAISLQFHENYFWGMAAHQNFSVTLLAVVSLYFLAKNTFSGFILATFFAIIGFFTSSAGLVIFSVGIMILFKQERYKFIVIWFILMVGFAILLINMAIYTPPIEFSFQKILNGLSFLGGISFFEGSNIATIILGTFICMFFSFYILKWGIRKKQNLTSFEMFFLGIILFTIIVGFLAGLKRSDVLLGRYRHYSALAVISIISLVYFRYIKNEDWKIKLLVACAFVYNICVVNVSAYDIRKHYEYLMADSYNWHVNHKLTAQFQSFCDNDRYFHAISNLKVKMPTDDKINFLIENLSKKNQIDTNTINIPLQTQFSEEKTVNNCVMKKLTIKTTLEKNLINKADTYFVVLHNDNNYFVFSIFPERPDVFNDNTKTNLDQTIYLQYLPSNTYKMSLIRFHNQKVLMYKNKNNQQIVI